MKEYRRNNKTGLGLVLIIAGAILLGLNFGWIPLSLIHISEPRDKRQSRMPSSA